MHCGIPARTGKSNRGRRLRWYFTRSACRHFIERNALPSPPLWSYSRLPCRSVSVYLPISSMGIHPRIMSCHVWFFRWSVNRLSGRIHLHAVKTVVASCSIVVKQARSAPIMWVDLWGLSVLSSGTPTGNPRILWWQCHFLKNLMLLAHTVIANSTPALKWFRTT
jgi:hypothetical protein